MATTLAKLNREIEKLQREAEALKAKEAKGVIARIREAIGQYQLTAADLGLEKAPTPAKKRRVPVKAAAKKAGKASRAGKARKAGKRASPKKTAGVIKYRDEAGNAWTGHGRAPAWFKAALESGKTSEDLEVKAS